MKHTVKHDVDAEAIRRAAERAFAFYQEHYQAYHPTLTWTTPQHAEIGFRARGLHVKGRLELLPGAIDMELDVPLILRVFKDRALRVIDAEVQRWIEDGKAGQRP